MHVVCAETDEQARYIASSMRLAVARLRTGGATTPLLPPEEASRFAPVGAEGEFVASFTRHFIEGSPELVRRRLIAVADQYGTNDLTIATNCFSFEDRVRSYQLVAEAWAASRSR